MSGFLRTGLRRTPTIPVTVLPQGKTVEIASGARLLDAVLLAGVGVKEDHCGGRARCGVCHVLVLQGGRGLSKMRKDESDWLARHGGKEPRSRLSCQALLGNHGVTIQLINH